MPGYGLPGGTNIPYGGKGFPQWTYDLADYFGVQASTYPGHQEGQRAEAGFAPNPQGLNRGIDWFGPTANLQRLANYLLSVRNFLEQVIWENPQTGQRVGVAGGDDVTTAPYYADDYSNHTDHVHTRQSRPIPMPGQAIPVPVSNRPAFTELPVWSGNSSGRSGTTIDLFILHTQEGGDGDAKALALWMNQNGVSYHYTVSTGRPTVTVCDVVDTDMGSWSVLSANDRSINLCFAGSKASWSRQEWLDNRDAIEVAAYLAVQDCRKYGIPITVIAPPYTSGRAGITDHNYVTTVLGDGTHTDVGPNFPWDIFAAAVAKHSDTTAPPATVTSDPFEELLMSDLRVPSLSIYATPGEPDISLVDLLRAIDAKEHRDLVDADARAGDLDAITRVARTAGGHGPYGNAVGPVNHARSVLADIERTNPAALQQLLKKA